MSVNQKDCLPPKEREKLPEEINFDKAVYGGISYAGQALAGMGLTYWLKEAGGKPLFEKMSAWLSKNVMGKLTPNKAKSVQQVHDFLVVSTMVGVGNAFILPVKWLENRKDKIVGYFVNRNNKAREDAGDGLTEEEKGHQVKLLDDLKNTPKQSWISLWLGRAFALGGVYAVLHSPLGQKINPIGEKAFSEGAGAALKATGVESEAAKKFAGIAFYDVLDSMISAGGLYVYSHFIHPKEKCAAPTKADSFRLANDDSTSEVSESSAAYTTKMGLKAPDSRLFTDRVVSTNYSPSISA